MSLPRVLSWATTHPGAKRSVNQDAFVNRADLGVWAVADGAGGHQGGEIASGMLRQALNGLPGSLQAADLLIRVRQVVANTHESLRRLAEARGPSVMMASTVVALIMHGILHYACLCGPGDSRARICCAKDGCTRSPHDHSLVQELMDTGAITAAEADSHHTHANIITRAVWRWKIRWR